MTQWISVHGILAQGYRVASGPSADYPYGTLERQRPIFAARGLDLSGYFDGTLNVDIRPQTFTMVKPEYTFQHVEWTDRHPPEHFSFSRCKVIYKDVEYDGWVYYPHPETKIRNFQNPSLMEVIAKTIPEIQYGDELDVLINAEEITVGNISDVAVNSTPEKKPEVPVNRNRLIVGIALVVILILLLIWAGLYPFLSDRSQSNPRSHIVQLGYCTASDIKPCIVSFSVDAENKMLVSLLTPANYADFYLTISNDSEENRYDCQKLEDFPTNVICTGNQMYPGVTLHFALVSTSTGQVFAKGDFAIIGLLLSTPVAGFAETASGTEITEPTESPTPLFLQILTPIPTKSATPTHSSYPNPSYPYP